MEWGSTGLCVAFQNLLTSTTKERLPGAHAGQALFGVPEEKRGLRHVGRRD